MSALGPVSGINIAAINRVIGSGDTTVSPVSNEPLDSCKAPTMIGPIVAPIGNNVLFRPPATATSRGDNFMSRGIVNNTGGNDIANTPIAKSIKYEIDIMSVFKRIRYINGSIKPANNSIGFLLPIF